MLLLAAWGAAIFRTSLRTPGRGLLTLVCLALGVALFVSVEHVREGTLKGFERAQVLDSGRSDLVLHAGEAGVDVSIFEHFSQVPDVVFAIPRVLARSFVATEQNPSETLTVMGLDLFRERLVLPDSSRSWVNAGELGSLQRSDDVIAISQKFAERHGLDLGSVIHLGTSHGVQAFTVGAIIDPRGPLTVFGSSAAIVSLHAGQVHFSGPDRYSRIEVFLKPEADTEAARAALQRAVGPGFTIEPALRRSQLFEGMTRSFRLALSLAGLVALAVSVLVVASALRFQVALQRNDIALRRAIGASRRQVLVSIVGEGLVLGLIASLLGFVLGAQIAGWLSTLVEQTLVGQYRVDIDVELPAFDWQQLIWSIAIGVGAALIASLPAAVHAAMVPPIRALRNPKQESPRTTRRGTLLASACLGYSVLSLLNGWFSIHPLLAAIEALTAIGGVTWFAPLFVAFTAKALAFLVPSRGSQLAALVELALSNLSRMPRSTTNAVRLLVIPLGFGMLLGVLNRSLEHSIQRALSHTLRGDLVVISLGQVVANWSQPLHESVEQSLRGVPGVAAVAGTRFVPWRWDARENGRDNETEIGLKAFDPPIVEEPLFALHDLSFETARQRVFETGQVLISDHLKRRRNIVVGSEITLDTPSGPHHFRVAGVVDDYAHPGGVIYLSRALYRELWGDPLVSQFRIAVANGYSPDAVSASIVQQLGSSLGLRVLQPEELRGQIASSVSQSFRFVRALEWVAFLVALLGAAGACTLGVLDRRRELSLLRAVGLSRRGLKGVLMLELLISGFVAAIYAAGVGAALGALWALVPLADVLGWHVSVAYPWERLSTVLAVGSLGMVTAGLLPISGLDRRLEPAPS